MISLYLFCLIVGGGLLLFSLLAGGHEDADGVLDVDADADANLDVDVDPDGDGFGADTLAHEFFSVRALIYFLAGFGATGALLEAFTPAAALTALLWAAGTGLAGALVAALVYGWLRRSESGLVGREPDHLVGLPAEVLLPIAGERRGKIRAIHAGRELELLARPFDGDATELARGATVVIVDMDGETALITPAPSLPRESP